MVHENKAIVWRLINEVLLGGRLGVVAEIFAPDYQAHDPSNPDRPGGIEGARAFAAMFQSGLSEQDYRVEDMIGEGSLVTYRWALSGRHTGTFMGVPPTGRAISITGIDAIRIANAKIAESWTAADALGLLRQLGVLPPPAAADSSVS
jgi:steroid delta-isomerase-like uncharacterized protein